MLPLVGIPATIVKFLKSYRQVFRKEAGFKHISRYINGLLMSPNKTLQGRGREIIALDWTFSYHPHSEKIFAAKEAYDYVNRCWSCYQTVVTASISNSSRVDGIAVEV